MNQLQIAAFALVCILVVQECTSDYVSCYSCATGCEDEFASDGVAKCDGKYCTKVKTEVAGIKAVVRGCTNFTKTAGCTEASLLSIKTKTCYCNTDDCNGTDSVQISTMALLVPASAFLYKLFF